MVVRQIIFHCAWLGLQVLSMLRFFAKLNIWLEMHSLALIDLAAASRAVYSAAKRRFRSIAWETISVHNVCSESFHIVSIMELSLIMRVIYLHRLSIILIVLQPDKRYLALFQEGAKWGKQIKRLQSLLLQIVLDLIAIIEIYVRRFCD